MEREFVLLNRSQNSFVLGWTATVKWAFVLSHYYFSFFVLRLHQLVVLELFTFLPFRACFGFEYLGEPFLLY